MYNKLFQKQKKHYENKITILKDMVREKEATINLQQYQLSKLRKTNEKLRKTIEENRDL